MNQLKKKTIAAISICTVMALTLSACNITITDGKTPAEQVDFSVEETISSETDNTSEGVSEESSAEEKTEIEISSELNTEENSEESLKEPERTSTESSESPSLTLESVDSDSDHSNQEPEKFSEELCEGTGYKFKTDKNWKLHAKDLNGVEFILSRRSPQSTSESTAMIGVNYITYSQEETSYLSDVGLVIVERYKNDGYAIKSHEKCSIGEYTAYNVTYSAVNENGQTILTSEMFIASDEKLSKGETITIALLTAEESIFTSMHEDFVSLLDNNLVFNETSADSSEMGTGSLDLEIETDSSSSETGNNNSSNISVDITDSWGVFSEDNEMFSTYLYLKDSVVDDTANAFFCIQEVTQGTEDHSMSEVGEILVAGLDDKYEIIDHGKCTANGLEAYRVILHSIQEGRTIVTDQVLVRDGGTVYALSVIALEDFYETAFKEAMPLFNSVTFAS